MHLFPAKERVMQEIGNLLERAGPALGMLFMFLVVAIMLGSFAVSIPRLLHRENHHFA